MLDDRTNQTSFSIGSRRRAAPLGDQENQLRGSLDSFSETAQPWLQAAALNSIQNLSGGADGARKPRGGKQSADKLPRQPLQDITDLFYGRVTLRPGMRRPSSE